MRCETERSRGRERRSVARAATTQVRGRDSPDHRRILSASDTAFRDLVKRRVERVVKHIHTLPGPRLIRYFLRRRQPAQPSERRCSHRVLLSTSTSRRHGRRTPPSRRLFPSRAVPRMFQRYEEDRNLSQWSDGGRLALPSSPPSGAPETPFVFKGGCWKLAVTSAQFAPCRRRAFFRWATFRTSATPPHTPRPPQLTQPGRIIAGLGSGSGT